MTQPSKFWLFLGIVLVCSGIGVGFGAVLLGLYFWNNLKNSIHRTRLDYHENVSDHVNAHEHYNSAKWYDSDTAEKMK